MNSWLPVACQKQERDLSEWNLHFAKVSLPKPKHNFVIFGWRFYFKIRNQNIKTHSEETQDLGTVHKSLGTPKIVARHYFSRVIKSLIIDPAFPYHVIYERPLIWHFDTIDVAIFIQILFVSVIFSINSKICCRGFEQKAIGIMDTCRLQKIEDISGIVKCITLE